MKNKINHFIKHSTLEKLLAEILMYHNKDLLDDGKPLFNSEQEKKYSHFASQHLKLNSLGKKTLF